MQNHLEGLADIDSVRIPRKVFSLLTRTRSCGDRRQGYARFEIDLHADTIATPDDGALSLSRYDNVILQNLLKILDR